MTATRLPAQTIQVRLEDASLDLVCFEYARQVLGDATRAGKLKGYVEATLAINPGLASARSILPLGMVINLPEFIIDTTVKQRRLWD